MRLISTYWPFYGSPDVSCDIAGFEVFSARYIEQLEPTDIFHIHDCYELTYVKSWFSNIETHKPRAIINDHWTLPHKILPDIEYYSIPAFAAKMSKSFRNCMMKNSFVTNHAANIMVNRFAMNRWAALKFADIWNINYDYTYSGSHRQVDLSAWLDKLTPEFLGSNFTQEHRSYCLAELGNPTKWINNANQRQEFDNNQYFISYQWYGGNFWTWHHGLNDLFGGSAVSLITESSDYMPALVYTEKTIYAIVGLTMPIWVGHPYAAEHWKRYGFDTFDDVIDHSYQWEVDPLKRYWLAFERNAAILQNLELARDIRNSMSARLLRNRELLLSGQLELISKREIDTWPADIAHICRPVMADRFDLDL
jgi:hypothetical protein